MIHEDFLIYYHKDSLLHKAHPIGKFLLLIVFSFMIMNKSFIVLPTGFIIVSIAALLSRLPLRIIVQGSGFVFFLTFVFRIFTFIDFSVHPFSLCINTPMLTESLLYIFRIMMIFFCNALFYTTTKLSDFRRALRNAEKQLIPGLTASCQPSLMLMLFLKFIPLSIASWHELEKAWQARGGKDGLYKLYKLLPKLIERMMVKAIETAQAMILKAVD